MHPQQIEFLELFNGQLQYVVPRWQRRYSWGQPQIERLIEDLMAAAAADDPETSHYGGTMLTFQEPGPAGVVKTIRVVDGQQRLTTVSILLSCIAHKLDSEGCCGEWTPEIIREDRLRNRGKPSEKVFKLRLQDGDDEEYQRILDGQPAGPGAVTQAWRTIRRFVDQNDTASLLRGLERLRVVSIGLDVKEDPQQIFESLNATGRPLAENEKIKNWLLMGLPDEQQQELHDTSWLEIERALGAQQTTEPIDIFLRDLLRWWTGNVSGRDKVYEELRRWAVRKGRTNARPDLCREFARLSKLYGIVTGSLSGHPHKRVERELCHLRAMGIDVHRPLSLRLLNDAESESGVEITNDALADVFHGIATWITRLWLADHPTSGLNKAMAEIAYGPGPSLNNDFTNYWLSRISKLQNSRTGVPHDREVREGIRTRQAYGGSATQTAFAILCAVMEAEHEEESPAREHLTMEHVMPQKLTHEWRCDLGEDADEIHKQYRHRLANLTLSGDKTNTGMGTKVFSAKKKAYRKSPIGMTRRLADIDSWDEAALEQRAVDFTDQVLSLWPWSISEQGQQEKFGNGDTLKWRIDAGNWHFEDIASQMTLNVAGMLIAQNPTNAQKLSGETLTRDVQHVSRFAVGDESGGLSFRPIPGCEDLVLYPYSRDYPTSAKRCEEMGKRCGVTIEVEFPKKSPAQEFWKFLKEFTGGVPGQKDTWRGESQWTSPLNSVGDIVSIYIGPNRLWLFVRTGNHSDPLNTAERMRHYSKVIQQEMGDQDISGDMEKNAAKGMTPVVQKEWNRDDEGEWPDAALWLKTQQERLALILAQY